ncbi:MAG TPA: serine hydrolase domain-containing protein, partial [Streptomyces sp.]|nr:serine hydrolase domain-containing protein [Streptomyces sp.]
RYSNTGYLVLGLLLEQVTHNSLADNLRTTIFEPLGMRTASLRRGSLPGAPMAHGYFLDEDVTSQYIFGASGGAVMTAPDVARFFTGLFAGKVVSRRSLAAMTAQHSDVVLDWDGYGYGVARRATDCGTALGHSGRLDGYVTEAWTVPSRDVTVVVLANRGENGGGGGVLGQFVDAALCG